MKANWTKFDTHFSLKLKQMDRLNSQMYKYFGLLEAENYWTR